MIQQTPNPGKMIGTPGPRIIKSNTPAPTITGAAPFEEVAHLLSQRPLLRWRSTAEHQDDDSDARAAKEAMEEPGESISYDALRRQLGLE